MTTDVRQHLVLVAERNRDARQRLTAALETSFAVMSCEFGEDVLRRLQDHRPDVVILGAPMYVDIGLSRRQLLQELLWRGFRDVARRVIILTSHPLDPDLLRRAREARVFAVAVQPVELQTVVDLAAACASGLADDHSTRWIGIDPPMPSEVFHGDLRAPNRPDPSQRSG